MIHAPSLHSHCQITLPAICLGIIAMVSNTLHADTLRLADGQAAGPQQLEGWTLDAGYQVQADSSRRGARLTTRRLLDHFALFVDASAAEGELDDVAVSGAVEHSGNGSGLGLFYTGLPDAGDFTTTLRVSYYRESTDVDTLLAVAGRQADGERDLRNQSLAVLFSPRNTILENGLNGYVAVGATYFRERFNLSVDNVVERRLSSGESGINAYLAAGIVYPYAGFRIYAVAAYEQEGSLSVGVRYHIKSL